MICFWWEICGDFLADDLVEVGELAVGFEAVEMRVEILFAADSWELKQCFGVAVRHVEYLWHSEAVVEEVLGIEFAFEVLEVAKTYSGEFVVAIIRTERYFGEAEFRVD